jgi:hypothetical protein
MHAKTLLSALFLLSMSCIVADEENSHVAKLMADMEQIKEQMVSLQSNSNISELKDQIAKLASQIEHLHMMTLKQNQMEIATVQSEFARQLEEIKAEIATTQEWNSKAFEVLTKTLDALQDKYMQKEAIVAYEENVPSELVQAIAQEEEKNEPERSSMMSSEKANEMGCTTPYKTMNVGVRHNEARGVGYSQGYTTFEGFFTSDDWGEYALPFLDLRFHVFNNAKLAGNAGLGFRTLLTSINHYFGMNAYYDVRNIHGLTVNQVGPGLELLGKRMEYRINGYFPVGRKSTHMGHAEFGEFKGNRLILKRRQKVALSGIDGEVGVHFLQKSSVWDLFAGGTPYFLWRNDQSTWGGKLRLNGGYKQYVVLEATGTYDRFFKWTIQGSVAFRYPFGPQPKRKGENCSPSQMDDLVIARATEYPYRFEIPMIRNHHKRQSARDPFTGKPLTFWFVDNTSSSNGTFESPFPTLVQAQDASAPDDVIYVFEGDGTTKGMDKGIILKNNQILFGSGIQQMLLTAQGNVTIPAFTSGAPLITNTAGSVVTLANGNEISGMNILASVTGNAVSGISIAGANIHNNSFTGNLVYEGIHILGAGTFNISNNTMTGPTTITDNNAIRVLNLDGQFTSTTISNNVISGFSFSMELTPSANPTTATGNVLVSGNNLSNFGKAGISWTTGMAGSTVQIIDNYILNNVATDGFNDGIFVDVNNPNDDGKVIMNNNTIITTTSGAAASCIEAKILSTLASCSTQFEIANNNMLVGPGAGSDGIFIATNLAGQVICASIFGNNIELTTTGAGFDSMDIDPVGGLVNIDNFSGNIAPNISFAPSGGGVVQFVPEGTCGFGN